MINSSLSYTVKSDNNVQKNKGGRPPKELTEDQKLAAIQHVTISGFWKMRLATFLRVDFKTLARILKEDKGFSSKIKSADAQFCANMISRAKPEFILRTKYRDEFPDSKIVDSEHGLNQELREFLEKQSKLLNARRRELDSQPTQK